MVNAGGILGGTGTGRHRGQFWRPMLSPGIRSEQSLLMETLSSVRAAPTASKLLLLPRTALMSPDRHTHRQQCAGDLLAGELSHEKYHRLHSSGLGGTIVQLSLQTRIYRRFSSQFELHHNRCDPESLGALGTAGMSASKRPRHLPQQLLQQRRHVTPAFCSRFPA